MDDIYTTLMEYEKSCDALQRRIDELSGRISGRSPLNPGESVKELENRRYLLYGQVAEMHRAIHQMQVYCGTGGDTPLSH